MKLYQKIASEVERYHRCIDNPAFKAAAFDAERALGDLESELPSGSGVDSGTEIDLENSTENRVVLTCSFHHMDENGGYDGWTDHVITITPSLVFEFVVDVAGENRGDIHDYLADLFNNCLDAEA